MFKFIHKLGQRRNAIRSLIMLIEQYGYGQSAKNMATHIIDSEWALLPENAFSLSKHLFHHFTVIAFCVANTSYSVAKKGTHPSDKELLHMLMAIFGEVVEVASASGAQQRFNLTESDMILLDTLLIRMNQLPDEAIFGH
ncbi:hypothetical protein FEM41_14970 [Jejubacter calystegiae]|uniref:Uncharacterized protein n=1 Tax=Jejubacter calystegiae TaxID=2579935 RepID=A0A4P8YME0_9ENTR|nr:hypothetical protein [Jejubacter calystegiae]QCT20854.1 hypothetical protein FEM41_14970 [Jejubacter calystegiae]